MQGVNDCSFRWLPLTMVMSKPLGLTAVSIFVFIIHILNLQRIAMHTYYNEDQAACLAYVTRFGNNVPLPPTPFSAATHCACTLVLIFSFIIKHPVQLLS